MSAGALAGRGTPAGTARYPGRVRTAHDHGHHDHGFHGIGIGRTGERA